MQRRKAVAFGRILLSPSPMDGDMMPSSSLCTGTRLLGFRAVGCGVVSHIHTEDDGGRSSTCEVRGRIVHWQASEWPILRRYTLSISSQIFQVLLIDRGVLDVGMSQPGVTGVIEGKFTVSYNFLLIKRLRWPLTRCDTTDFAVQYGYIALSV
jgi:hypothetical protein